MVTSRRARVAVSVRDVIEQIGGQQLIPNRFQHRRRYALFQVKASHLGDIGR
jgi:hypothetical protein